MSEFKSVSSIADFKTLDESDMLLGYLDGFDGLPCPASARSRSFYHGWRNGMADAGHMARDDAQHMLAEEFSHSAPSTLH